MVADQLRARGITDERVLAAMGAIPREAFVPASLQRDAYADEALPIEAGQTISQPFMVARMTEDLHVNPGDRILEIGTGLRLPGGGPGLAWRPRHLARAAAQPSSRRRGRGSRPSVRRRPRRDPRPDPWLRRDPRGRRQSRRPGRRAVGRDHRHRSGAIHPGCAARPTRETAAGSSSRSGPATASCSPSSPATATNGWSARTATASSSRSSARAASRADDRRADARRPLTPGDRATRVGILARP